MTIRLGDKRISRVIPIAGGITGRDFVISVSRAGVELLEKGRRFTVSVTWSDILARAERLAGEYRHREQLRNRAVRRIAEKRSRSVIAF